MNNILLSLCYVKDSILITYAYTQLSDIFPAYSPLGYTKSVHVRREKSTLSGDVDQHLIVSTHKWEMKCIQYDVRLMDRCVILKVFHRKHLARRIKQ